jgi:pimeloyl-ACP methyl ester carboxylesterase
MTERMIEIDGVEVCTDAFGDPGAPPILLIMGMGASMIWWEEEFCRMLADGGRFAIRYDHRDTGRSTAYEPGHPGYDGEDLIRDAVAVLDAYELPAAHVVGMSMGGALAQLVALAFPERVASLVLISTSPAVPVDRGLSPTSKEYAGFIAGAEVDWSDASSVVRYVVDDWRALAGRDRPFDAAGTRALAATDVERARSFASAQNHALLSGDEPARRPLSSIQVPTLVIHGTADPLFPPDHGEALAEEIPNARLLTLEGAGHGLYRADWDVVVPAIVEHTGR